jgi:glycosyltransferase involved in cell wall biosynthesis
MAPRISVLTAVFDPEREHLEACLRSVADQEFTDWEHVLVDDGSTQPWVTEVLAAAATADPRVRVVERAENGGIVAASNDALAAATGEWMALLDHDDELEPTALATMSAAATDDIDVVYSDHDLLRADGRYASPSYKPDFSPERLRSQNYITHFLMARRSLVDEVGGFRVGYDGAQDHDLVLRLTEQARRVAHVPQVLYHWRQSPGSVTSDRENKRWAFDAGVRAVADHCHRVGIEATVERTEHDGCYRVVRHVDEQPLVSVVIPTRGSAGRVWGVSRSYVVEAVRSILETSSYTNLEFVIVHDTATPAPVMRALERLLGDRLVPVEYDRPTFNFSEKMNIGALHATGDLLLLLNDDTELIEPDSIGTLVGLLADDDVAMAGGKLLFEDGTLQHGGHVYHHDLMHICFGWSGDSPGPWPLRPLAVARECSGVTAAASLLKRSVFDEVGGFPEALPLNYNDVDLCLKIRALGHRIVWTPWASWYHFESRTRHSVLRPDEYQFVNQRWHTEINNDPYYNPNLAPNRNDWLERPLRSGAAPIETRPNSAQRLVARLRGR